VYWRGEKTEKAKQTNEKMKQIGEMKADP